MSNLKTKFGAKLKKVRLSKEITQEKLADYIDVTVETVSNIERGVYGPRFDKLEKIAECLNVPVSLLFEFDE